MTLTHIALTNLKRRKTKACLILAGLFIGVASVVAMISFIDAMKRDIHDKVDLYGANIIITPHTENIALSYGGLSLGGVSFDMARIEEKELEKIKTIKNAANIGAIGPTVLGPVTVAGRRILLVGTDFEAAKVIKAWWKIQGSTPKGEEVVVGYDLARSLGLEQGGSLTVNSVKYPVTGTLERTGSQDDGLIFMPLAAAQKVLDKRGRVSMVEVAALCAECPLDEMVKQIAAVLPQADVMPIMQVVKGRMETLGYFKKFAYAVSAVILLVGCLMVTVTMMGNIRERTTEIGIFRAIGFRQSHIVKIILIEAGIMAGLAGIIGYLAGYAAADGILPRTVGISDLPVAFNAYIAGGSLLLAIILGLLAAIYPSLVAARLDPNESLRAL